MDKAQIEALRDRYNAMSERNYRYYQETGMSRYARQQKQADDIVDLANLALNAVDTAHAYSNLRGDFSSIASKAGRVVHGGRQEDAMKLLGEIYRRGCSLGLCSDVWGGA